jgi:hypothetical protein
VKTIFRATSKFLDDVRRDLERPHPFALERVGFITTRAAGGRGFLLVLAQSYHPVDDEDYLADRNVGAMMGSEAIRKGLNLALLQKVGVFHVHLHAHHGRPWFSSVDLREQMKFLPDFFKVRPELPHGAIVLSFDKVAGRIWLRPRRVRRISEFNVVGPRLSFDDQSRVDVMA